MTIIKRIDALITNMQTICNSDDRTAEAVAVHTADELAKCRDVAKELLEACDEVVNDLEKLIRGDDFHGMTTGDVLGAMRDTLYEALNKVEGEGPMTKHAPFPWTITQRGPGYYLIDAQGQTVAAMNASKQDAEFILLACNSHQPMLDACKAAKAELITMRQTFVDAIGFDPHEDECSIFQEDLEDLDRAVATVAAAIATASSES